VLSDAILHHNFPLWENTNLFIRENKMNVYKFQCTVWVRGESVEEALKELHDEVDYHFSLDNNLVALESDNGTLCEGELK
jgi:hypothetical protein